MITTSGVRPVSPDNRDYSHTKTFGSIPVFLGDYDGDAGLTNPDQNAEARPNGCTGYTQSEVCADRDKRIYDPGYTYDKTRMMEGTLGQDVGCDIRDSLKSTRVYGVKAIGESDLQAFGHRRGAYYAIEPAPDYFDGVRSALVKGHSVSMATPWYDIFNLPRAGIIQAPSDYGQKSSYHNYKACGWKTINGTVYLKIKPWIGPQYGDNGFAYMPREVVNQLLNQTYTGAFVLDDYDPNAKTVTMYNIFEVILSYLHRILNSHAH